MLLYAVSRIQTIEQRPEVSSTIEANLAKRRKDKEPKPQAQPGPPRPKKIKQLRLSLDVPMQVQSMGDLARDW